MLPLSSASVASQSALYSVSLFLPLYIYTLVFYHPAGPDPNEFASRMTALATSV